MKMAQEDIITAIKTSIDVCVIFNQTDLLKKSIKKPCKKLEFNTNPNINAGHNERSANQNERQNEFHSSKLGENPSLPK